MAKRNAKTQNVQFKGGAQRSERAVPYHLLEGLHEGIRRMARRAQLGAETYGEGNWQRSIGDPDAAGEFAADALNHVQEHLFKYAAGDEPDDDHLGAVLWGIAVLAEIEKRQDVSNIRELR